MSELEQERIFLVVADGAPGGGTTVVASLARELIKTNWDVHLLTDAGSHLAQLFVGEKITVHDLRFFESRTDRALAAAIAHIRARFPPDIIHVHGARALFACRSILRSQPTVYTVHGYHLLNHGRLKRMAATLVERLNTRRVSRIVFVSANDQSLGLHHRLFARRIPTTVIRNGIDLHELGLMPMPDRQPGHPLRVAFLSRLSYPKDPLLAVDVAEALGSGFHMTMIGGGELEDEVRMRIGERGLDWCVQVTGPLPREMALDHLRRSDVMLMTSLWEGMPLAPLEAMAVGAVVVAPDIAALREVFDVPGAGILVAGRQPAQFADAIRSLLDDAARSRTRSLARAHVERKFSWQKTWELHRAVYFEALGGESEIRPSTPVCESDRSPLVGDARAPDQSRHP
jgi:glycosyltransferase involved in cell wall biosynthesis